MRNAVLYIAMSLDGYIANEGGGIGWLQGDGSDPRHPGSYPAFFETVDTIVMGGRTYRQIVTELSPGCWPYEGRQTYVLTHRQPADREGVVFTAQDPRTLVAVLRRQEGKDIWICGGASVAAQLWEEIDRFHITVVPTLLGKGTSLFPAPGARLPLELVSTQRYNGMVDLVYRRRA